MQAHAHIDSRDATVLSSRDLQFVTSRLASTSFAAPSAPLYTQHMTSSLSSASLLRAQSQGRPSSSPLSSLSASGKMATQQREGLGSSGGARDSKTLGSSMWQSMPGTYMDAAQAEQARREDLRMRSQQRYKHWGNTLEATREKKKRDRLKRLEQIEQTQQALDKEEESLAEQRRREAIDRANRLLYQSNDKVKSFHSALLLSNVIKEREMQREILKQRTEQKKQIDSMYDRMMEEKRQTELQREADEQSQRKLQSKSLADTQMQQLAALHSRYQRERVEEMEEGERIKRIALQAQKEAEASEARRQMRKKENAQAFVKFNEQQMLLKEEEARREAEEERKIAEFAQEKERMLHKRQEVEAAKFKHKQGIHAALIETQYQHLQQLRSKEDQRIEKQVQEQAAKSEAQHVAEQQRKHHLKLAMLKAREAQLERKTADEEARMRQERKMTEEWRIRNKQLELEAEDLARRERELALRLQADLRTQVVSREGRERQERMRELEEVQRQKLAAEKERVAFEAYVSQLTSSFAAEDKSLAPVQRTLTKQMARETRIQPAGGFR